MSETQIPKIKSSGVSASIPRPVPQQTNVSESLSKNDKHLETQYEEDAEELEEDLDEGEEQEKKSGPHFDTVDTFFYVSIAVLGDIFDGIWITRVFFAPLTLLFLYMKGVDQMISKNMLSQGIELVPVVGWLPISTTMAIFTIVLTNHPEILDKIGPAGEALEKIQAVNKKKKI
ncbi:MAG: hypothetical protein WC099_02145 [Candidatus Paceibacterota bacterium]